MKTFKLNELKKKISKDNWGVVADYLNGTCDGDILPNLLSWEEIDAVMEYLSDDGNVFCEPSYMQQVIESAICIMMYSRISMEYLNLVRI